MEKAFAIHRYFMQRTLEIGWQYTANYGTLQAGSGMSAVDQLALDDATLITTDLHLRQDNKHYFSKLNIPKLLFISIAPLVSTKVATPL